MASWNMLAVEATFFEVSPENWIHRDRASLHKLRDAGRPVQLHGVSLNLGGTSAFDPVFLRQVRSLMYELGSDHYSDHLAASGDAHQLYDLFPIPFTRTEVHRVSDRIARVQDMLGCRINVENVTWYTNTRELDETDFLMSVVERADCGILLDLNNVAVNHKNHGTWTPLQFVARVDLARVSYLHVAGHEFHERFGLHMDTHSRPVELSTAAFARSLCLQHGLPILLEWDNDVPEMQVINEQLSCLKPSLTL